MPTTEPFAGSQLAAALRELNIPDVSAPDLGALPFARGGAGIDYAGIAATVLAQETRAPVSLPSAPSSFYFLDAPGRASAARPSIPDRPRVGCRLRQSSTGQPRFPPLRRGRAASIL